MEALNNLPDVTGCVIILSGGLDSTIAMRLCVEKYGSENVHALSFNYGQRQLYELTQAAKSCEQLGVNHFVADMAFLGVMNQGFSANVDRDIAMPTIKDVLGDPQPATYISNRNMIMLSIAAGYAETQGVQTVVCGLQSRDAYGYFDTTQEFTDRVNDTLALNRKNPVTIIAPFVELSKAEELEILRSLDGDLSLASLTLSCYNPRLVYESKFDHDKRSIHLNADSISEPTVESCGRCPTCAERIKAFMDIKEVDPIPYSVNIPWRT